MGLQPNQRGPLMGVEGAGRRWWRGEVEREGQREEAIKHNTHNINYAVTGFPHKDCCLEFRFCTNWFFLGNRNFISKLKTINGISEFRQYQQHQPSISTISTHNIQECSVYITICLLTENGSVYSRPISRI